MRDLLSKEFAMQLNLSQVSYTYPGASMPAITNVSATFPQGWTGIIGNNGCGKSTLAQIAAGIVKPDSGSIYPNLFATYCQQDSSQAPQNLLDLASDWGHEGQVVRSLLHIEDDWFWRYETLSGGQQKRLQIACALYTRPDLLIMDEPTNDLDSATRTIVSKALTSFDGIGILISHDRKLLDDLVNQSLTYESPYWVMRPGGYSKSSAQAAIERASKIKNREKAISETKRLKAEAQRRSEEASRQKGKRSKHNLDKKDSDTREKIGRAIISGKDGIAGKLSSTMNKRLTKAEDGLSRQFISKQYDNTISKLGKASKSNYVVHLEQSCLQADNFSIEVPEIWISPTEHVALVGENGTGKSLIVKNIIEVIPNNIRTAFIPQNIGPHEREKALMVLHKQTPEQKGRILSIVARLNSNPDKLLDGNDLSPGELRKLILAEQLIAEPNFLVLDEPTNHLDVGSIEGLQNMLTEFPGAVLLVTHDTLLANAVAQTKWETKKEKDTCKLKTSFTS